MTRICRSVVMVAMTMLAIVAGIAAPSHVEAQSDGAEIEVVFADAERQDPLAIPAAFGVVLTTPSAGDPVSCVLVAPVDAPEAGAAADTGPCATVLIPDDAGVSGSVVYGGEAVIDPVPVEFVVATDDSQPADTTAPADTTGSTDTADTTEPTDTTGSTDTADTTAPADTTTPTDVGNMGADLEARVDTVYLTVPDPPGGVIVGTVSDDLAGSVSVTYPSESCGDGFVADDGTFLLLVLADQCEFGDDDERTMTIKFANGGEYELAAPQEATEDRGELDLVPSLGRGGPVTIGDVDAQPGLRVVFSRNDVECGRSDINENHAYAVGLSPPCTPDADAAAGGVAVSIAESTLIIQDFDLGLEARRPIGFAVAEEAAVVMGRATTEEGPIADGESISFSRASGEQTVSCGDAVVQRDGAYLITLTGECRSGGGSLKATLPNGASTGLSLDGSSQVTTVNLAFEPVTPPTTTTVPPPTQREESVLAPWHVIVLLSSILLITIISIFVRWNTTKQPNAMDDLIKAAARDPSPEKINAVRELADRYHPPGLRSAFELALLGIVTVALVTLTLSGTLTEQGVLTILSAIVGYAAGRSALGDR